MCRSAKLPNDLLSVAVFPWQVGTVAGSNSSSSSSGRALGSSPAAGSNAVLAMGSSNGQVLAFSVAAGKVLGSFAGHEDAVSCVAALGQEGSSLLTASWDCAIKVREAKGLTTSQSRDLRGRLSGKSHSTPRSIDSESLDLRLWQ